MWSRHKSKIKACVIIPTWNGKELLRICLLSLRRQTFKSFEVLVLDNGSTDGTGEYVRKNFGEFRLIPLDKNLGFSAAVNTGINQSKGEYVILLNNDTEVDKKCVEFLVQAADEHPEAGFVAAKILNFYKRKIIDNAGDYIDGGGHPNTRGTGEKDGPEFNRPGYTFMVTGGGSLFKRSAIERVGLFDEEYFVYMEDVDFCLRAQLQGIKGWYEPKAKIYHIRMATSSRNLPLFQYLTFRNMTINVIKNFPKGLLLYDFNWLRVILVNLNTVMYLFRRGFGASALKAEWYILKHLRPLLKKRATIQKNKKVSDQYFIENVKRKKITFFKLFPRGF